MAPKKKELFDLDGDGKMSAIEKKMAEAFALFDTDNDGKLSKEEFIAVLTLAPNEWTKPKFTAAQAAKQFDHVNVDTDGHISAKEFVKRWSGAYTRNTIRDAQASLKKDKKAAEALFKAIDRDGSESIDATELRWLVEQKGGEMGLEWTQAERDKIIKKYDTDDLYEKTGKPGLSKQEFFKLLNDMVEVESAKAGSKKPGQTKFKLEEKKMADSLSPLESYNI